MATTLTTSTIQAKLTWDYENVDAVMGNTVNANSDNYSTSMTQGTGAAGTADLLYAKSLTIAGGGNTTLDLAGSLTDAFGNVLTMARVKVIKIQLTTDTTASAIAIGNGTNPFINWISPSTGTISVRNGGCF